MSWLELLSPFPTRTRRLTFGPTTPPFSLLFGNSSPRPLLNIIKQIDSTATIAAKKKFSHMEAPKIQKRRKDLVQQEIEEAAPNPHPVSIAQVQLVRESNFSFLDHWIDLASVLESVQDSDAREVRIDNVGRTGDIRTDDAEEVDQLQERKVTEEIVNKTAKKNVVKFI
jgi:hypothetical protein